MEFKKSILACCMACAISTPALMADSGLVLGVFGGLGSISTETELRGGQFGWAKIREEEKSLSGGAWGAKIGYDAYFDERQALRTYVDYTQQKYTTNSFSAGDMDITTYALNLEYRFDLLPIVGVFVGPNIHYTDLKANNNVWDTKGVGFGVGGGIVLSPLPFLELEARVRFIGMADNKEKRGEYLLTPADKLIPGVTSKKAEIDSPFNAFVGVNFKF